jgi:hypothetical protein
MGGSSGFLRAANGVEMAGAEKKLLSRQLVLASAAVRERHCANARAASDHLFQIAKPNHCTLSS